MGLDSRKPDCFMQITTVQMRLQSDRQLYYLLSVAEQAGLSLSLQFLVKNASRFLGSAVAQCLTGD